METNKEKKILGYKQLKAKHNQAPYFLIGLAGAIILIGLLSIVLWANNLVTPSVPAFIFLSLAVSFAFTFMDALLMATLLQYHYGKY
jgi:hypothetical protein